MKTNNLIYSLALLVFSMSFGCAQNTLDSELKKVDYEGFIELSDSLSNYRATRLIDESTFNTFRKQDNTIVLDTRSKKAFEEIHIKGAIHLNFSDFTEKKLKAVIPNYTTRILIYCNNNFESQKPSLYNKSIRLALNIPTFINLYGYGYQNIYELDDYIKEEKTIIPLLINTEN